MAASLPRPPTAKLARKVEDWRWTSLHRFLFGTPEERALLVDWPEPRPRGWRSYVNGVETEAKLQALRRSIQRSVPFGSESWTNRMITKLGLESTIRPRGRPRKDNNCS